MLTEFLFDSALSHFFSATNIFWFAMGVVASLTTTLIKMKIKKENSPRKKKAIIIALIFFVGCSFSLLCCNFKEINKSTGKQVSFACQTFKKVFDKITDDE